MFKMLLLSLLRKPKEDNDQWSRLCQLDCVSKERLALLETNGYHPESRGYQGLLKREIQICLAILKHDPNSSRVGRARVETLLGRCTDENFVKRQHAELNIDRPR